MTNACVAHEWFFLNPAWLGDIISFSSVCWTSFSYMSLSIIFVHMLVSDMGRCCAGFLVSCLSFGIRKMFACHIALGIF